MNLRSSAFLFLCYLLLSLSALAKESFITFDASEKAVQLLHSNQYTFLVTDAGVYEIKAKKAVKKYASQDKINCALLLDSALMLGSDKGLLQLDLKSFTSQAVRLGVKEEATKITTLFRDEENKVWIGAEAYGIFRMEKDTIIRENNVQPLNCGIATADKSIWVGTDIGLYRATDKQWIRYNEEGVANFEIPGNTVENLILDNLSNLWILTSDGIAIFATKEDHEKHHDEHGHEHLPSAKYIGKPGNRIQNIHYLKDKGYLFATDMGLLFMPSSPGTQELENLESDKVQDAEKLYKVKIPADGGKASLDCHSFYVLNNTLWLVSGNRIVKMKVSKNEESSE